MGHLAGSTKRRVLILAILLGACLVAFELPVLHNRLTPAFNLRASCATCRARNGPVPILSIPAPTPSGEPLVQEPRHELLQQLQTQPPENATEPQQQQLLPLLLQRRGKPQQLHKQQPEHQLQQPGHSQQQLEQQQGGAQQQPQPQQQGGSQQQPQQQRQQPEQQLQRQAEGQQQLQQQAEPEQQQQQGQSQEQQAQPHGGAEQQQQQQGQPQEQQPQQQGEASQPRQQQQQQQRKDRAPPPVPHHIYLGGSGGSADTPMDPCPDRFIPGSWVGPPSALRLAASQGIKGSSHGAAMGALQGNYGEATGDSSKAAAARKLWGSYEEVEGSGFGAATAPYRRSTTLPFTEEAQQAIWDNQHPANCSTAKSLVFQPPFSGLGSVIHQMTVGLAVAVDLGRVFIEDPGAAWAQGPFCREERTITGCYMLPPAGCMPSEEQMKSNTVSADEQDLSAQTGPAMVTVSMGQIMHKRALVPERLHLKLLTIAMPEKHHHYWWRAQGIAYLVRPNNRTLQELARRERALLRGRPPAPGCVSLYVRRGDKASEAPVFSDQQYAEVLERLAKGDPSLTRQVFLSTEDAGSVRFFAEEFACGGTGGDGSRSGTGDGVSGSTGGRGGAACRGRSHSRREWRSRAMLRSSGDNGTAAGAHDDTSHAENDAWEVSYLDIPTWRSMPELLQQSASSGTGADANGAPALNSLLALDLAARCDGYVASIYSNWARVIDELRSTVRCKGAAPYVDLFYHGDQQQEMDFNW